MRLREATYRKTLEVPKEYLRNPLTPFLQGF
jgi:hypothetical protein